MQVLNFALNHGSKRADTTIRAEQLRLEIHNTLIRTVDDVVQIMRW